MNSVSTVSTVTVMTAIIRNNLCVCKKSESHIIPECFRTKINDVTDRSTATTVIAVAAKVGHGFCEHLHIVNGDRSVHILGTMYII